MERVDLADVVGAYVSLRRCGSLLRGLSPFKEERTPSFYVNPDRRIFKCYSSGHGGDAIEFLQLKEQMSFVEAVEFLAKKYDFSLDFESGQRQSGSPRGVLFALHERMAALYRETFFSATPQAHSARLYWTNVRKFSLDCAERCGIGLAPSDWQASLGPFLRAYAEDALLDSGLFVRPQSRPDRIFPRFRGRLMIPIADGLGRTIAFVGRTLDGLTHPSEAAAKYVNSPETALFHKGSVLFGMHRARAALGGGEPFLLTEGPLDCIRCWECGLATAVAALGTAATAQHMSTLRRHGIEMECLLDGDEAGRAAALRIIAHAFRAGLGIRFLRLPESMDPDEYLLAEGVEGIRRLRASALSPIELLVEAYLPPGGGHSYAHRQQGLRDILTAIGTAESQSVELELLSQLSQKTTIPLEALRADHARWSPMEQFSEAPADAAPTGTPTTRSGEHLLWTFLCREELRPALAATIPPEWLEGGESSDRLLNYFIGEYANGIGPDEARSELEEEERSYVCGLLFTPRGGDDEDFKVCLSQCLGGVHRRYVVRQLAALDGDESEEASRRRTALRRELLHPPAFRLCGAAVRETGAMEPKATAGAVSGSCVPFPLT
jgi:DNA primase